jgi:hypothetical protein
MHDQQLVLLEAQALTRPPTPQPTPDKLQNSPIYQHNIQDADVNHTQALP